MATSKTLELSIKIAGRMDKSLTAAINGTQSKIGSLTKCPWTPPRWIASLL